MYQNICIFQLYTLSVSGVPEERVEHIVCGGKVNVIIKRNIFEFELMRPFLDLLHHLPIDR